jgi:hypothetical protein
VISPVMNAEERLRAATRAAADTVAPGSAPPLRLPGEQPGPARWDQRHRWLRPMVPLAAAAAVAAVVIASLTLTRGVHTASPGGAASPAQSAALSSVPPYYVAIAGRPDAPEHVVIRASATGAVLATVKPPRPYRSFTFVSGAADDRTFVLAAQRWWNVTSGTRGEDAQQRDNTTPVVFFRLRFDPRTRTAQLTRLSRVAGPQAAQLAGIAVSPDGTRLALDLQQAEIKVVSLATGSSQRWVWPGTTPSSGTWVGNGKPGGQPLSWAADGRVLAFQFWIQSGGITQVRLLDTTSPDGSLRATRAAVSFVGHGQVKTGPIGNSIITPDGTKIVTVASRTRGSGFGVMEFSVRTGQPVIPPPTGNTTSLGRALGQLVRPHPDRGSPVRAVRRSPDRRPARRPVHATARGPGGHQQRGLVARPRTRRAAQPGGGRLGSRDC